MVPGAGINRDGEVVRVKSPGFLALQPVLRTAFRCVFREKLATLARGAAPPPVLEPAVWEKCWVKTRIGRRRVSLCEGPRLAGIGAGSGARPCRGGEEG